MMKAAASLVVSVGGGVDGEEKLGEEKLEQEVSSAPEEKNAEEPVSKQMQEADLKANSDFDGASILVVHSSSQIDGSSVSRRVIKLLVDKLRSLGAADVVSRECTNLPYIDEEFIAKSRNPLKHKARGDASDANSSVWEVSCACCDELQRADIIIIAAPCYNFSIPASLKAWVDLVTIVKKTYTYGTNGPEGLLRGKTAFLVATTGGADVGSAFDFGTRYMRHILALIGVNTVKVVAVPHGDTGEAETLIQDLL